MTVSKSYGVPSTNEDGQIIDKPIKNMFLQCVKTLFASQFVDFDFLLFGKWEGKLQWPLHCQQGKIQPVDHHDALVVCIPVQAEKSDLVGSQRLAGDRTVSVLRTVYRKTVVVIDSTSRFRRFHQTSEDRQVDLVQSMVDFLSSGFRVTVYTALEVHGIPVLDGRQRQEYHAIQPADFSAFSISIQEISLQLISCFCN